MSISLSACTGTPSGALTEATSGNNVIHFGASENAGAKRYIKVLNPPNGLNIPAELGGGSIREGGVVAEGNFKVVVGSAQPCTLPGEMLNRGEWCTVGVEFVSGERSKSALYVQEYGPRGEPNRLLASIEITS